MSIEKAIAEHQAGNIDVAQTLYREILKSNSNDFDALHMLGVSYHQINEHNTAIEYFKKAITTGVIDAGVWSNLGSAYISMQMYDEALSALGKAIAIDDTFILAHLNIGNIYKLTEQHQKAIAAYEKAIAIFPDFVKAYQNLASVYLTMHENTKAEMAFSKILSIEPDNKIAKHMLASLHGETTKQAPDEHIADLFDFYSSNFDSHLVKTLGYDIPAKISIALDGIVDDGFVFNHVLDLGCGTGLVGECIQAICNEITGVDLSAQMIEKTRARGIYLNAFVSNIIDYVRECEQDFDLVICADVFPYLGELDELFLLINKRLNKNALFIYSTEKTDEYPYVLKNTARYAHSEQYLAELARQNQWTLKQIETVNIRKHGDHWIQGNFCIYQS